MIKTENIAEEMAMAGRVISPRSPFFEVIGSREKFEAFIRTLVKENKEEAVDFFKKIASLND